MEASFGLSIGGIDPGGIITHPLCTQVFFQTAGFFTNDVTCQHCYDTGTARCFLFGCIWPEKASYLAGHNSELFVWFSTKRYLCVSIQHCGHAIMIYCEIIYKNILKCAWYWVSLGITLRWFFPLSLLLIEAQLYLYLYFYSYLYLKICICKIYQFVYCWLLPDDSSPLSLLLNEASP